MSTGKEPNMTRTQFYILCNEMHKRAEQVLKEQPSLTRAAEQFSGWLKFKVTSRAVSEAQEATGVRWSVRKRRADAGEKINRYRVMARSIIRLYKKLGEEVPSDLIAAYASLEGKSPEEVANYWKNEQKIQPAQVQDGQQRGTTFPQGSPAQYRPGNANK